MILTTTKQRMDAYRSDRRTQTPQTPREPRRNQNTPAYLRRLCLRSLTPEHVTHLHRAERSLDIQHYRTPAASTTVPARGKRAPTPPAYQKLRDKDASPKRKGIMTTIGPSRPCTTSLYNHHQYFPPPSPSASSTSSPHRRCSATRSNLTTRLSSRVRAEGGPVPGPRQSTTKRYTATRYTTAKETAKE